jgi:hypothetical protein
MTAAAIARPPSRPRTFPAHYQAHGRLYRAIVSLPQGMCERDRPLQERWVFFDCPGAERAAERLQELLALAWNTSTTGWADSGLIYNIVTASDVADQNGAHDDAAWFECAWGSEGTQYVSPDDVDYFCTPIVRARLEAALARATRGAAQEGGAA